MAVRRNHQPLLPATSVFSNDGKTLAPDGCYRLLLTVTWAPGPTFAGILMNPSKARAVEDRLQPDQTVSKFIGYAKRERCGSLWLANAFAVCCTDSKKLPSLSAPVGNPLCDEYIRRTVERAAIGGVLVVGWGKLPDCLAWRLSEVRQLLRDAGAQPMCFGTNSNGSPRHPLYLPGDEPLVEYPL